MGFAKRHPNIERSQVSDVSVGFSRSSVRQPIVPSIFDHPRRFTWSHLDCHYHPTAAKVRTGLYRSPRIMIAHSNPRKLVSVGHGCHVHRPPFEKTCDPGCRVHRRSLSPPDNRPRTMNEKTPDVTVAAFAYAAKPLLTTARSLLRNKSQAKRQIDGQIGTVAGLRPWQ